MQEDAKEAPADASEADRKAVFLQAKTLLGAAEPDFKAMDFVTRGIHPRFWGVSREQVNIFVDEVRAAVASGKLVNPSKEAAGAFYYPEEKFNAADVGPNMHLVNSQLIKPRTKEPDAVFGVPFLSFALMVNSSTGGLECQLFVSHAWDEGCFQFGPFLDAAFPRECTGAYICFLSNPQHNPELIRSLCSSPRASPFFKVLEAEPKRMVMLGNSNTPIHRRLWCVYEAFEGMTLGIPTDIAGDRSLLVSNRTAFENIKEARDKLDQYQHPLRWRGPRSCHPGVRKRLTEYSLSMGFGVAAALGLLAAYSELGGGGGPTPPAVPVIAAALLILPSVTLFLVQRIIKRRTRGERHRLEHVIEESKGEIIDVRQAQCTSTDDKRAILAEIAGKEKDINDFIRALLVATVGIAAANIVTATDEEVQDYFDGGDGDDGDGGDGDGDGDGDGEGGDGDGGGD